MPRGRKRLPDEIKALKGNPGKRRLHLLEHAAYEARPEELSSIAMPEFLTHPREQEIFRRVVEDYLQRRIAREVDLISYGRWATYVHGWWSCKELLDSSKTNTRYIKQQSKHVERWVPHPTWALMQEYEKHMSALEDRLGLNPQARQSILRGLASMPAQLAGLVTEAAGTVEQEQPAPPPIEEEDSPLGFLKGAVH